MRVSRLFVMVIAVVLTAVGWVSAQQAGISIPEGSIPDRQEHMNAIKRQFESAGLKVGDPFPAISIFDAAGKRFNTSSLKGRYTVLISGCLT